MYIKIEEKNKIGGYGITEKYFAYTYSNDNVRSKLIVVKHVLQQLVFESKEDKVNRLYIRENILGYVSRKEEVTHLINLNTLDSIVINTVLYNLFPNTSSIYGRLYYNLSENENNTIYDLTTGKSKKVVDKEIIGYIILNTVDHIITKKGSSIYVYNKTDFSLLWQKDLSEITSYTDWDRYHKGDVNNVYSYKNNIIVVAGNSILSLEINNGAIQWQTTYDDFQPHTLHIVENIGYLCKGAYYSLIDLDTGDKLLEVKLLRPFGFNPKYKNSNVAMIKSDMTYHEGYFYFTDKHEEQRYLGKIEPQTGVVEDYQILEGITSSIHPPRFHNDKMFLLDSENTLHIYEKDKAACSASSC